MKRIDLFGVIKTSGIKNKDLPSILDEFVLRNFEGTLPSNFSEQIKWFISKFKQKYEKNNRMMTRLLQKEQEWLGNKFGCLSIE